jgi:hypothetical protein
VEQAVLHHPATLIEDPRAAVPSVDVEVAVDPEPSSSGVTESVPFWTSLSLEELAQQQGVEPVSDLDEISDLWPLDDDPDEMLHHILDERRGRRRVAEEGDAA